MGGKGGESTVSRVRKNKRDKRIGGEVIGFV
jgi:hypothetical protein